MWRDEAYLLDILLAARKVLQYAGGLSRDAFEQDELVQSAVMRWLTIVGEAACKISPEFQASHADIPWSDMKGLRHRLVHEYFRIQLPIVWDTIQVDLPKLLEQIEPLVPPE
jgi:uncharacterized protein with HEPN domain